MKERIKRIHVGQVGSSRGVELPELTCLQKDSFNSFLEQGIEDILSRVSPITDHTADSYSLSLYKPRIEEPKMGTEEAIFKGVSHELRVFCQAELTDLKSGEVVVQEVFLGNIPQITERGTFIINGIERCIVSQLARASGVYFEAVDHPAVERKLYTASIRTDRGAWVELVTHRDKVIYARINQKGKFPVTMLLRAFGVNHQDLFRMFHDVDTEEVSYIDQTLKKDVTENREDSLLEIYSKTNPGDPRIVENAEGFLQNTFFNPRYFSLGQVGRFKLNERLGLNFPDDQEEFHLLQMKDLVEIVRELIRLNVTQDKPDDIDDLSNRRIRPVGELLEMSFERGVRMMERNIQDRLSLASMDKAITPSILVNSRPIVARVREFFGTSRLSQFMEQSNILSEISHMRRISALGPGGLTRERAGPAVRDVQPSHYGRLGIIKTPEGPNIGLNLSLGLFAQVNRLGFLEAPFLKVEKKDDGVYLTDKVEFFSARDEKNFRIAESTIEMNEEGKLMGKTVSVRYKGDFVFAPVSKVDYVDLYPSEVLGLSASLIPFVSSDVGNRALMGSNMQCQAVPLLVPHASYTGTGIERDAVKDSGWGFFAKENGEVVYVDSQRIEVKYAGGDKESYHLTKFRRTNNNTCYRQTPCVFPGDKFKKGDCLVDGPSHEGGELATGVDLLMAFMPWDGYNYEDSIVISESVVKRDLLSSVHIKTYQAMVMETKLGPEEVTADIPNVSTECLRNLDEEGVVVVGAQVKPGDILVGKVAPKGEMELTAEERLLRAIFGEKAREVRNTSLNMPHGEQGRVIGVTVLTKETAEELPPGVIKIIRVDVAQLRKIKEGDKLSGRHGSKGCVAKIVPDEDMPHMADGTVIDILMNPVSILGRMNIGQMMEAHLGWAGHELNEYYAIVPFDRMRPGLIREKLKEAGLPEDGKMQLIDGRTGRPFDYPVTIGYANVMKLHHLVEDKIHARSTGPYSLITQQPLGGKSQMGGQRLGEMEVWALEAYGAAHTLQEMLTIKSDDVIGRAKAFEAIIKGEPIPEARIPESFKLLVKEINSLALQVIPLGADGEEMEVKSDDFEAEKAKKDMSWEALASVAKKQEESLEDNSENKDDETAESEVEEKGEDE